jgi:hypothetical protein
MFGEPIGLERKVRILPKDMGFKAGNRITLRLPAQLKDE